MFSLRCVDIGTKLGESLRSNSRWTSLVRSTLGWQTVRCLATSTQGTVKVKLHSRTPYIIFAGDKMADLREANPGISIPALGKMLGQMWRILPDADKKVYKDQYLQEKEAFEVEKRAQMEKLTDEEKTALKEEAREKRKRKVIRKKKKLLKDLEKPKPGDVNPYVLFVKAKALERGDASFQQYARGLSEFWKQMPEEDKQPFIDRARQNSTEYRQRLAEWERKMIAEGHEDLVRRSALGRPTRSKKAKVRAKKVPRKARAKKAVRAKTTTQNAVPTKSTATQTVALKSTTSARPKRVPSAAMSSSKGQKSGKKIEE